MKRFATLILFCALLSLGADGCEQTVYTPVNAKTSIRNEVGEIYTVEHDGHKFVLWDGGHNGGILHHPSCPCLQ